MYQPSEKTKQLDMWKDPSLAMGDRTKKIFEDEEGWHHRFRREVTNRYGKQSGMVYALRDSA